MEKTKVICLIGASGSGKTTITKELEKTGYNIIQSYTTRPSREDGEWGHTFIEDCFVSYDNNGNLHYISEGLAANSKTYWGKDMIAYFNSYNSGHHYFATDEQVLRGYTNIYIVDSKGAEQVHDFYKGTDVEVITVYLQVDREVRQDRLQRRTANNIVIKHGGIDNGDGTVQIDHLHSDIKTIEKISEELTNFILDGDSEIKDRLSKDDKLFQTVKCDYVVDGNQEIDMVVDLVRDVI